MVKEIIRNLSAQVKRAKRYKNPMDDAGWGDQTGVLITPNDAQEIIKVLKAVDKNFPTRDWLIETVDIIVDEYQCLGSETIADGIIDRWNGKNPIG